MNKLDGLFIVAIVIVLVGVWFLLGRPVWTFRHIGGGFLLTFGITWMIDLKIKRSRA